MIKFTLIPNPHHKMKLQKNQVFRNNRSKVTYIIGNLHLHSVSWRKCCEVGAVSRKSGSSVICHIVSIVHISKTKKIYTWSEWYEKTCPEQQKDNDKYKEQLQRVIFETSYLETFVHSDDEIRPVKDNGKDKANDNGNNNNKGNPM